MSHRDSPLLEISDVSHSYGRRRRLSHVSSVVAPGVTGLLGPNGAGKTTLLKLLAGAMPLQQGSIRYADVRWEQHSSEAAGLVAYLPQRFELMEWSSVVRNVAYAAWAQGMSAEQAHSQALATLTRVGLADRANDRVRSLSGGMRQRVGIACALVHRPRIVLLDEPTVGLDPSQRVEIRGVIHEAAEDAIVLVSTHMVEDLANIAQHVMVLAEGTLRFQGTIDELRELGEASETAHASALESGYYAALTTDSSGL